MQYLFDTNSVIHLLVDAYPALTRRVAATEAGEIGISVISFAEVALGVYRGKPPPQSLLDAFVADVPLVPFDEPAARTYASLPFKRGSYDRLIAAQAVNLDLVVITRNTRDFADIPGLKVENWTV
jgi:tRNA(fMet)-specific endonuclease VapC